MPVVQFGIGSEWEVSAISGQRERMGTLNTRGRECEFVDPAHRAALRGFTTAATRDRNYASFCCAAIEAASTRLTISPDLRRVLNRCPASTCRASRTTLPVRASVVME